MARTARNVITPALAVLVFACGGGRDRGPDGGRASLFDGGRMFLDAGDGGPRVFVDAGPPLFADAVWQVQCRCYGACSGMPSRDVQHLDGEAHEGGGIIAVNCSLGDRGGGKVLTASVVNSEGYGLEIRDVEFPIGGGPISGPGCTVSVTEGGQEYRGQCGANPPSVVQPCRISNLTLNTDMDGNPQIEGDLLCFHLAATADPTLRRELAKPDLAVSGAGMGEMCQPTDASEAVHFRFVNCRGL